MSVNSGELIPISVCVVNYNGECYLEDSLGSLYAQREKFAEILLVDNASEDRSLEIVRKLFPFVKIIQLRKNRGPSAARNAGFEAATFNRILFIDNDVSLAPGCAEQLMKALVENPRAAVAMPRILYDKRRDIIQYDGADSHYLGLMILHNENLHIEQAARSVKKINSMVTACFLLDREVFTNDGPFDESFFMYFEDHDFGFRVRISGNKILSVPSALAYHQEGTQGLSLRQSGQYSKIRVFCLIRNRWFILIKNYEFRTLFILSPALLIYEVFQVVGVIKKGWLIQWFTALFWIFTHILSIFRKRKTVQMSRKTPDREILQGGPIPFSKFLVRSSLERTGKNFIDRLTSDYWKKVGKYV